MKLLKEAIRTLVRRSGFDIVRARKGSIGKDTIGVDPFIDMQRFIKGQKQPVIFDVGANVGQSVDRFIRAFPVSSIHSFEPSPSTYKKLRKHCEKIPGVRTWNYGVGSCNRTLVFQENIHSEMSSFLAPSKACWGHIVKVTDVQVITLDSFAREQNIEFIHILKSDTQGYDFEVFKGARRLMSENRIGTIYFEFTFSDMYKDLPSFYDVFRYLSENNFDLVTFYEPHFQEELVSWTDALFINRDYYLKIIEQRHVEESAARRR